MRARGLVVAIVGPLLAVPMVIGTGPTPPLATAIEGQPTTLIGQEIESGSSSETNPLVVILDLSGSMRDDDGTGTNKLIAAKASLERVLRQQGEGAVVGVWGYPHDRNCGAGSFVLPPEPIKNLPTAIATVDALFADGNTPTGKAITSAVDELKSKGYSRATIILISDGESNCSSPACPAAQQLAGSGFDLTVNAVGFQQSARGREELECVANATSGRYFDADDGDELINRLDELSSASISLEVRYSSRAAAGASTLIAMTVTNSSSREAKGLRVNLAFSAGGPSSFMPAVLPPTYDIGNLGPGDSLTRTWNVSTGVRTSSTELAFGVTAWGNGIDAVRVPGRITVSSDELTKDALGDLLDGVRDQGYPLVIMGDSYSSGEGTEDYINSDDKCHRSMKTYLAPAFRDDPQNVRIVACSGAITGNIFTAQHPYTTSEGSRSQLSQLAEVTGPGAVLLTFGGNDIGFEHIIRKCANLGTCSDDKDFVRDVALAVAGLSKPLEGAYKQLWIEANSPDDVEARGGAFAPIIVLPYPQITHDYSKGSCANFNVAEVQFTNKLVVALNASIKQAVSEAQDQGYEVYIATPVQAAFLPDHTYCASGEQAYVHGIVGSILNARAESFHPKVSGYAAKTSALIDWVWATSRIEPDAELSRLGDKGWISRVVDNVLSSIGSGTANFDAGGASTVSANSTLAVSATGFASHEGVTFVLTSSPTTLGTLQADEYGKVAGELWIPDHVTLGKHVLNAYGFDSNGDYVTQQLSVQVEAPIPWHVALSLAAGAILFAGAIALTAVGLLRRRRALHAGPEPIDET